MYRTERRKYGKSVLSAGKCKIHLKIAQFRYYSIYWVDKIFGGESSVIKAINKLMHLILPVIFRNIFRGLSKLNITSLPLLKGQAIYVMMSKRERQKT